MGRIVKSKVEKVVGSYLSSTNVLCTDKWRAYKKYCMGVYTKFMTHTILLGLPNLTLVKSY